MKKIISLALVSILALSAMGCSANAKNVPLANNGDKVIVEPAPVDGTEPAPSEIMKLIVKIQEVDKENQQIKASEVYNDNQVDYVVYPTNGVEIDLSVFSVGDIVAVDAEAIMESYPAQVPAKSIDKATKEQIDAAVQPPTCIVLEPVDFSEMPYNQLPESVVNAIDQQRIDAGHDIIQTEDGTYLVVYMGERNTGGYFITVDAIGLAGNDLMVTATENAPGKDAMVTMAFTHPYTVVKLNEKMIVEKENVRVDRLSSEGEETSGVDNGDEYYVTPLDHYDEGETIIIGELMMIDGDYIHVISGDLVQVFKGNPEDYQHFYINEKIELVKNNSNFTIKPYLKEDFSINHTNMGQIIETVEGTISKLDNDLFIIKSDEKEITLKGAENLAIAVGDTVTVDYVEFFDGDLYAIAAMKDSNWMTLTVKGIERTDEGFMVLDMATASNSELSTIVTVNQSTTIRLNLSEIKEGDTIKVYPASVKESNPLEVMADRITK